jgi:hypothetical protein
MSQAKRLVLLTGAALSFGAANVALADQSNDNVRAIVSEMMADAETRSSLLAGGDAGHDGKFFIAGDGFRLNVGGQIQFRYVMDFRDNNVAPNDDFSNGFQTRRTKLDFNGAINKDWDFRVLFSFDREEGGAGLEEAWGRYNFSNGVKFRWGQFKLPMLREELVSSAKQLAAERSVTNEVFTQDRSQGVELAAEYEGWRWAIAFSDGLDSENTDFNDSGSSNSTPFRIAGEAEYALTARAEFLFGGNWKMFEDFTAAKGQDFGFLLGVAGHFQQSTQTPNPADQDFNAFQVTADASLEGDSWNLYGAFIYRLEDPVNGAASELNDFGAVLQGGWRFAENTEVFARWDAIFADSDRFSSGEDNFHFLTFGLNQYYAGHAAKATIDAVWCLSDNSNLVSSGILPDTGTGLLGDSNENEVALRLQMQLLF